MGASTSWKPQGLSRPVQGLLYLMGCDAVWISEQDRLLGLLDSEVRTMIFRREIPNDNAALPRTPHSTSTTPHYAVISVSCYFLPLAPTCFPQLPVLEHSNLLLIFVVPSIMLYSSEISPTRCNNCVFILRNGFTLPLLDSALSLWRLCLSTVVLADII